jgi:putative MATE family efflux protein
MKSLKDPEIPANYLFSKEDLKKLIMPLMVEQLLTVLVGMCDSIMVAYAGEAAMSGVSLVDTIYVLIINIFVALATGGAVVAGQFLGMGRDEEGCRAVNQLVLFIAAAGLGVAVFIILGQNILLYGVFGHIEEDVRINARTYLMITAFSIPFIALYNGGAAIFRAMGNSRLPMRISIIMNLINVAGNATLVYVFAMGAAGVAIPTLVSRMFAGVTILFFLSRCKGRLHIFHPFRIHFDRALLKKILFIGVPNGVENSMFQLGKILLISVVSTLGTASIAANAIGNVVCNFQSLASMSMGLAILPVISRCVGANDYEQVKFYIHLMIKKAYIYGIAGILLVFALMPLIMRAYNVSPEAESAAVMILIYHGTAAMVIHPFAFAFPSVLRASNDVRYCMLVSSLSMWIVRIGGALAAVFLLHMGVFGIWFAMPFDWTVRAAFFIRRYRSGKWKLKHLPDMPAEESD